jgi:hypothetical protein
MYNFVYTKNNDIIEGKDNIAAYFYADERGPNLETNFSLWN